MSPIEKYQFTLRFDNASHTLTAQNGLSIEELSSLLGALSKAVGVSENEQLVLSEIRGNCYALVLTTFSQSKFTEIKNLHEKITSHGRRDFTQSQRVYATALKKIIDVNNLHFQAYDKEKKFFVTTKNITIPEESVQYFNRGTVYGRITSIGGRTLEGKTFITISDSSLQISIGAEQERQLLKHYKKERIRFIVRKKIRIEDSKEKIVDAELIDFEVLDAKPFLDTVYALTNNTTHFKGIRDSVKSVRKLRD